MESQFLRVFNFKTNKIFADLGYRENWYDYTHEVTGQRLFYKKSLMNFKF